LLHIWHIFRLHWYIRCKKIWQPWFNRDFGAEWLLGGNVLYSVSWRANVS